MTNDYGVAVIGGGIVGLAHAWMAARRGLRVILLDRSRAAEGASVRNFGMVWPIGQPAGGMHKLALRSRELWLELGKLGVLPVEECGSIHLAHNRDELEVHHEFCSLGTHEVCMLTAREVEQRSPLANPDGLLGGMYSATELRVDPRRASARIAAWLAEAHGVECNFRTPVAAVEDNVVLAADGRRWQAERIVVCSGSDLLTLYPKILEASGLVLCKLQMMKAVAQPGPERATPHLASGLTLRHYASFKECPSLKKVRSRIARESPELDQYGIHVMVSQLAGGEVILGDSHEYGDNISPFDKKAIDDLILREARKVFRLDDWTIGECWNGIYAKHPSLPVFQAQACGGVQVFVGTGGAGMTMAFGLAESAWQRWSGEA